MILRRISARAIYLIIIFFECRSLLVSAQDDAPFDCHLNVGLLTYDLTTLGEITVSRTRNTPPSMMVDSLRFNLCEDLKVEDGPASDQCPSGTRVCLTKTNKKDGVEDRIIAVIPIAQTSHLHPEYTSLSSPKGLSLILHGSPYPSSPEPQTFNLTLLCATDTSDPNITSYNTSQLQLDWSAPAGCGFQGDGGHHEDDTKKEGGEKSGSLGSGMGWFFLVLLLAFAAYFCLGAYYNYSTYGATGVDLIPHRDFWNEVPYMLRDVVSHLCSTVRPRHTSNRGGYISV